MDDTAHARCDSERNPTGWDLCGLWLSSAYSGFNTGAGE